MNRRSEFGELLRGYRLAAGLTQEVLAEQAGLSARGIADLERGIHRFPYPDTVERLAAALNLGEHDRSRLASMRRRSASADAPHAESTPIPLVGRRAEWRHLQSAWHEANVSGARCVVLEGEAGIGKSHLARELQIWADRKGASTAYARAYAAEGQLSYAPVTEWLRSPAIRAAIARLDVRSLRDVVQLAPDLLTEQPDRVDPADATDPRHRERFFQSLARAVLSTNAPLLLVLDDLQWCDQDTLEWLHYLLRFDMDARLLLVGTARIDEVGPRHPLATLLLDLRAGGRVTELELGPLDAADTAELAIRVAGRMLDADETTRLFEETEGQPLFVVETVRGLAGSSSHASVPLAHARVADGARPLPPKVYAVIAARLAQLSDATRDIVRLAATIGRSFTLELLATASTRDMDSVVAAIDELWERKLIREQSASVFDFSHDRIREVAYTDMSAARRGLVHRRVAQALEAAAGASGENMSAEVAAHYEQAGLLAAAVPHYRRAAELAQRVHAHHEAIRLLGRGIDLLCTLPADQERDQQELAMQISLGTSYVETIGYGAAAAVAPYRRAQELSVRLGQPPSPPVLRGLAIASITRTEFDQAQELGNTLLHLATERSDALLLVEGHYVVGVSLFWKGELVSARDHLEQALSYYPAGGAAEHVSLYAQDPRVVCSSRLAVGLWLLGHPEDARNMMTDAVRLAERLSHPFSLTYALTWSVVLATLELNVPLAQEHNDACTTVSREQHMDSFVGSQAFARGWILAERGDAQAGIRLMQEGMALHRAAPISHHLPWFAGLVAEQYGKIGQAEEGLTLVSDALCVVERTNERWCEAELHRVRGTLLELHGETPNAERAFQKALRVARQQHARAFELRTLSSLNARQELQPAG